MEQKTHRRRKRLKCGPYTLKHGRVAKDTCMTPDFMIRVRDAYNKTHPEATRRINTDDPQEILRTLKRRAQYCNNEGEEECWLSTIDDRDLKRDIYKHVYAPFAPKDWKKNPNQWLTNFDILNVMRQYEYTYPHFRFIGPSPIDFDAKPDDDKCVTTEICQFNLAKELNGSRPAKESKSGKPAKELNGGLNGGKTHFGFVFNLDEHDEPGSHWVSMFIDVPNKFIYFFDSASLLLPSEIDVFIKRVQKQGLELPESPIHFKVYQNKVEHQFGNTECGMYSLFFIITMLTGKVYSGKNKGSLRAIGLEKKLDLFTKRKIPDKMVEKYRNVYYNG